MIYFKVFHKTKQNTQQYQIENKPQKKEAQKHKKSQHSIKQTHYQSNLQQNVRFQQKNTTAKQPNINKKTKKKNTMI